MERRLGSVFWLKGLAVLLAVFVGFTIVSRVTASVTVAKVSVINPSERKILHTVRAEGIIEQKGTFAVRTEADLLVQQVDVREGDPVEKGVVLFTLDLNDLEEKITDMEDQIHTLELQNEALEETKSLSDAKRNTDILRAEEDYTDTIRRNDEAVAQAEQELDEASEAVAQAENALKAVRDETALAEAQAAYDACKAAEQEKSQALDAALDTRQEQIKAAERALEDAKSPVLSDNSTQINDITKQDLERDLKKLQELREQGGCIYAPEGGVVTKLDVAVGQKTTDVAAVTMSDTGTGVRFVAQIAKEDSTYIAAGDAVTLKGTLKDEVSCEIASVTADETGELLTVTADLDAGQFQIGERVSMEAVSESQTYSSVIPVTALLQENGKMFVLVLDTEDTILGEQYVARKVEVEVPDKNESYAALESTAIGSDDQIITDTDRYVEAGDRVRLMEE